MESLLRTRIPDHAMIQAYADDIVVSITGRSRPQLKERAKEILNLVRDWGAHRTLQFSAKKSAAVILRGDLLPNFYIEMGNDRIKVTGAAKLLGLWLEQDRTFKTHVDKLREKNLGLFSRLRGVVGKNWGLSRENALIIYKTVFIPKMSYAAKFWAEEAKKSKAIKTLTVIQRTPLLGMSSAYSTTSNMALQVLTGTLPLDLEVRLQGVIANCRQIPAIERAQILEHTKNQIIEEWQRRWDSSTKGRLTHRFFPNIDARLKTPIWLNHNLVQFLTGHGNFRAKLYSFKLKPDPDCICGNGEETAEHVIFNCARTTCMTERLRMTVLRAGHDWPCELSTLVSSRAIFMAFDKFASAALMRDGS